MRLSFYKSFLTFVFAILLPGIGYAQHCVKGKVVDSESQKALQGVAVIVKGTTRGVITDSTGTFSICNQSRIDALIISHLGYFPVEAKVVGGNDVLMVTLKPTVISIEQVVVTATLNPQSTWEVPAMVTAIDSVNVKGSPNTNVDNFLKTIPGLFVDRSNGVYSKNASVTMRGLDGSNRVLILYDGAPLNKTSYGFINWSLISPDLVDQIEVVHGPSSALFGNNAMAGVINIRTKNPIDSPFYGTVTAEAGGFGLLGARATLGGKIPVLKKGVNLMTYGFWREGDGYIAEPLAIRDSTNMPLYLKEKGATFKMFIPVTDSSSFFVGGNIYTDKRGAGRTVYMSDGSYDAYTTQRIRFGYNGKVEEYLLDIYGFAQHEVYKRQNENLNTSAEYKLFHTIQVSGDVGLWANASRQLIFSNNITFGIDLKHGWMDAEDIYRTSTDYVERDGKVTFAAAFVQDEQNLFNGKLKILAGLRFDYATFFDGYLNVVDPTKNTGFANDTVAYFPENSWQSINPKLGVRFMPYDWMSVYGSVSSGFMPAKLDDLCSSRKITKGFKLANPSLKPEHLITYELGGGVKFNNMIRLDIAAFYSNGSDFQYFVSTGDSIDTGGSEIKPIVKRENITSVRVYGGEISLKVVPVKWMLLRGNYSFNRSKITDFEANPLVNIDLTNKALAEVPIEQASIEAFVVSKYVNVGLIWTFIGEQWGDEVNSYKNDSWNTFDLRIWKEYKDFKLTLDVFDLLDKPYADKKGLMSPGRFFQMSLSYSFK
ncbi:MAG TPA: TonB-dependent receptor [Tenuifilaceae bacterium]|nr:TonB-dependent receptor [Tenuifilaceae bacterium]